MRGGEQREGTKAKRVDGNNGFANLQFFKTNQKLLLNHSHNLCFKAKICHRIRPLYYKTLARIKFVPKSVKHVIKPKKWFPDTSLVDQVGAEYLTKTMVWGNKSVATAGKRPTQEIN